MIRLGTRGSALATAQSRLVADLITRATGQPVELIIIRTEGDDITVPLDAPARPGAFVTALREALLEGRIDVAVHSFKDLPSAGPLGLVLCAVPARADARDALVSRTGVPLAELPAGSSIGTSSPRRAAALGRVRPDLRIVGIRGNVDTRLRKVREGEVDAAVLAVAGMSRLGRLPEATELLPLEVMLPAPAQGALAVEARLGDPLADALTVLDDPESRLLVSAERAVLVGVGAQCSTAVGAHAELDRGRGESQLVLDAELSNHRGVAHRRITRSLVLTADADQLLAAQHLGLRVAAELLQTGAGRQQS